MLPLRTTPAWICLTAVAMLCLQSASLAPVQSQTEKVGLTGRVQLSRKYPPEAGLKLLEDILSRVRSTPQLAMAKQQRLTLQNEEQSQNAANSPTDYRLAIKPSESKNLPLSPPPQAIIGFAPQAQTYGGGGQNLADAAGKGFWERQDKAKSLASNSMTRGNMVTGAAGGNRSQGLWEMDGEQLAVRQGMSPESARRLSQSIGGLYGALNKVDQISNAKVTVAAAPKTAREAKASDDYMSGAKKAERLRNTTLDSHITASKPGQLRSNQVYGDEGFSQKEADFDYKVALSPPTVVMGIPTVRLRSSENQANRALAVMGNMQKRNLNGWTIWSCNRPGTKDPLVQMYIRHGRVEALRIFDPSMVAPDLGVHIGDDLAVLKARFGEPAFILSEPLPGTGQNYIYPISQIGFLVSRSNPGAPPQVASLLIFNVQ